MANRRPNIAPLLEMPTFTMLVSPRQDSNDDRRLPLHLVAGRCCDPCWSVSLIVRTSWRARQGSNLWPSAPEARKPDANSLFVSYLPVLPRGAATRNRGLGLNVNAFCTASANRGSTTTCV
jgi:hypothetical protein